MINSELQKMILNELEKTPDHPVTEIVYGSHMTAVTSRKTGLATWSGDTHPVSFASLPENPEKSSARELSQLLLDKDPVKSSLGLAAVNSLLPTLNCKQKEEINAKDLILRLGENKNVAIIGHFPFVEKIRHRFNNFMVFERSPHPGDVDAAKIPELLPMAELVAITATTITNGTLARVLDHCSPKAVKIIIGPSTPLCASLFDMGFHYIAGTIVKDKELVQQGIKEGCSFKKLEGTIPVIYSKQ